MLLRKWRAISVSRELIGLPLTRKQHDEIRPQRPKLRLEEIDKNAYRHPPVRQRAPRDMPLGGDLDGCVANSFFRVR